MQCAYPDVWLCIFGRKCQTTDSSALTEWWRSTTHTASMSSSQTAPWGSDTLCRVSHCRDRSDPAAFSTAAFIFFISCKFGLMNCCCICSCVRGGGVVSLPRPTSLFFPFLPAISSSPEVSLSASVLLRLQLCSVSLSNSYFLSYRNEYIFYMNSCAGLCSWLCQKVVEPHSEEMNRRHFSLWKLHSYLFILGN